MEQKETIQINNKLSKGVVTQNGTYISYKTVWYGDNNSFFQTLYKELEAFLRNNKIRFKDHDFKIYKSYDSISRKRCITISVDMDEPVLEDSVDHNSAKILPYESDSIN